MGVKFLSAKEAVMELESGRTLVTDGFIGGAFPEELALELEKQYLETGYQGFNAGLLCRAGQWQGQGAEPSRT